MNEVMEKRNICSKEFRNSYRSYNSLPRKNGILQTLAVLNCIKPNLNRYLRNLIAVLTGHYLLEDTCSKAIRTMTYEANVMTNMQRIIIR